jgi:hypothetical protein
MKRILLSVFLFLSANVLLAQSGDISGKIKDEKGEGIPFATVAVVQNGKIVKSVPTDFDGNYTLKPLTPGKYDVKYSYIGYQPILRTGVVVSAEKSTYLDVQLKPSDDVLAEVQVIEYKVPLIDAGKTTSGNTITQEDIAKLPTRDIQSIAATTSGAYQADEGSGINIKGGRTDGTAIYIDGIRVRGNVSVPASAISSLTVITGGVPARYGDQTGGAISVTTRGPSSQFNGGIELVSSEFMDAYGYNLVSGNLTGPIYTNKKTNRTIAGFFISGEFERYRDNDPSAVGSWKVNEDKYKQLQQTPLIKNPVQEGYSYASETLTKDDLVLIKSRRNVANNQYRAIGKLDLKPSEAINITIGGNYNYEKYHDYIDRYALLNPENNPLYVNQTYRGFIRFTHNISASGSKDEDKTEKKSSPIQNAYYTLQFDYEKYKTSYGDDTHFENYFDYGYIGKFDKLTNPTYNFVKGQERLVIGDNNDTAYLTGWQQTGNKDSFITFTAGDVNPLAASYTSTYFDLVNGLDAKDLYDNLNSIQSNKANVNGLGNRNLMSTYSIWFNSGRQFNGSGKINNDQYTIKLDGAFDILKPGSESRNKHSIEFGFQFEQRQERLYGILPIGLWDLMRRLTNSHISEDAINTNPFLLINGQNYLYNDPNRPAFGFNDTIQLNKVSVTKEQSNFDKNLRTKLGLDPNGIEDINIDALAPNTFDLNMFSADELLNPNTGPYVNYYGYNYLGQKLNGKTSFNDFFTKKDENGVLKREIGAFQPIYIAGYIQDKFQFKDLTFNIGVRVDRYDANQKVMRDPYSLFQIQTVEEFAANPNYSYYTKPGSIGDNYKVYVDDNTSNTPTVIGYRNGDVWYNAAGDQLSSGAQVANASSNGKITPMFTDPNVAIAKEGALIRDPDKFNPDGSFVDYKPQVNIMPRLQFSFSLTDKALFYAHYDVLTQRPQSGISNGAVTETRNFSDPYQFLWWDNISSGTLMNNPNLKPEKTIDFELGFRQKVSNTSAISIQAFYRESKDMVQVVRKAYTYPGVSQAYLTLGNVDFGTTKGFNIDYDLRRTGHLQMKLNYTLQFAEGTGSDNQTQLNIVSQDNSANLRTISPLSYDARHTFNATIDWRYGQGSDYNGPYIGKQQIFSNSGINFVFTARSGTPYTKQQNATAEALSGFPNRPVTLGAVNGARMPWVFRLNTKINKDFNVKVGKKKEGKDQREMNFSVYLLIQNIFNAKNPVKVYRYTGNPSDDGYLGSANGKLDVSNRAYPESYKDLYRAYVNFPDNYSKPRNIRLGLVVGF